MAPIARSSGKRFGLMFWVLVVCTIVTIIVTIMMVYRMSQKPQPVPSIPAPISMNPVSAPAPLIADSTIDATKPTAELAEPYVDGQQSTGKMVYLYSSSCGWCDRFNPVWQDFAERYTGSLELSKIEAQDPASAAYDVSGYPTVIIERDGSVVATFEGDRTVETLLKFAKAHEKM